MQYKKNEYQPPEPTPGKYVIHIIAVVDTPDAWHIRYDIATGPSAGWAQCMYQRTGHWLLTQRVDKVQAKQVADCIIYAAQVKSMPDVAGHTLVASIQYTDGRVTQTGHQYRRIARYYPLTPDSIRPDDIRVSGSSSWSAGSPDMVRASMIARYAGLPVMLADVREKSSPMLDWCADHKITVLPMIFAAGDYMTPQSTVLVDRKDSIAELYHNFASTASYQSYSTAADIADAMGKRLVYIIAADPDDNIKTLDDLQHWQGNIPGLGPVTGATMYDHICRYMSIHSNTDFVFVPRDAQCALIYATLQGGKMKNNKDIIDMYILQRTWDPSNTVDASLAMLSLAQMQSITDAIHRSVSTMTPVERTVLQGRIDGHSNVDIAARLGLDQSYVSRVYRSAVGKIDF